MFRVNRKTNKLRNIKSKRNKTITDNEITSTNKDSVIRDVSTQPAPPNIMGRNSNLVLSVLSILLTIERITLKKLTKNNLSKKPSIRSRRKNPMF